MDEKCLRRERNVFAYDFKEFLSEQDAVNYARKINRWKMPAGQRKFFKISMEVCFPEILRVEKFIIAFNFDECETSLRGTIESAKKSRSFLEGKTKIFTIDRDIIWPEGEDILTQETSKRIGVKSD
jgi:hypothetical protein